MSDKRIEEIKERLAEGVAGYWPTFYPDDSSVRIEGATSNYRYGTFSADLIASAPSDIEYLISRAEKLEESQAKAKVLHETLREEHIIYRDHDCEAEVSFYGCSCSEDSFNEKFWWEEGKETDAHHTPDCLARPGYLEER